MTNLARRTAMAIALIGQALTATGAVAQNADPNATLSATISALDASVFDAYNKCDLATFGRAFAPTVEFYHDQGGATFDRKTVVANTKKFICGKVHRELVAASLRVYPSRTLARSKKVSIDSARFRLVIAKGSPNSSSSGDTGAANGSSPGC